MKILLIIILLVFFTNEFITGQTNCGCISKPDYNEIITCDTITFANGTILYRQFNCDSSWLTIENINHDKKILYSLKKDLIELTPRLGYQLVKEYSNALLFMNRQASGGGFPINYELLSKENGEVLKVIGPVLFYSKNQMRELIVTLNNDTIPALSFYDLKTKKTTQYPISNKINNVTRYMSNEIFPENHFQNASLEGNSFEIEYSYKDPGNDNWLKTKIHVELIDK